MEGTYVRMESLGSNITKSIGIVYSLDMFKMPPKDID